MSCLIQFFSVFCLICAFSCKADATKDLIQYKVYTPTPETEFHVITVDPKEVTILPVCAENSYGLDTVGNMARRSGALAAINGGFFRYNSQENNAVPAGLLKIANLWHGITYQPRGALGWDPQRNNVLMDIVQTDSQVVLQNHSLPINAMNKIVQGDRAALLSSNFNEAIEVNNVLAISILDQRVQSLQNSGKIVIPADGYVYILNGSLQQKVTDLKIGDAALVKIQIKPQIEKNTAKMWNKQPFVISGGPLLIHKGKKINDFVAEKLYPEFINKRHARTAIGVLPDKRWVFVVIERNLLDNATGATIPELRDFMASLGCTAALNLDGGGSSSMYIENVKYNTLFEQQVTNAIVIVPKQQ